MIKGGHCYFSCLRSDGAAGADIIRTGTPLLTL
jgi:hypothetical protein